jgi:hypothetical protein
MDLVDVRSLETRFVGLEMIPKDISCPTPGRTKRTVRAEDSRFVIVEMIYEKPTKRVRCDVAHGRRVKCPATPRKKKYKKASGKKAKKIVPIPFPSLVV